MHGTFLFISVERRWIAVMLFLHNSNPSSSYICVLERNRNSFDLGVVIQCIMTHLSTPATLLVSTKG